MWVHCDICEKGFDSHDGGIIKDGVTYCQNCEEDPDAEPQPTENEEDLEWN